MKNQHDQRRRTLLQWLAGTAVTSTLAGTVGEAAAASASNAKGKGKDIARIGDAAMALEFDSQLRCRVVSRRGPRPTAVTAFAASERLGLARDRWIGNFALSSQAADRVDGPHGPGVRHRLTGIAAEGVEKTVAVTFYARQPGFAVLRVSYRNTGDKPLPVAAWISSAHTLRPAAGRKPEFWTFSGASHADRRDWVQPLVPGFDQRNFMGMNASDYGSGTPAADVWHRECGWRSATSTPCRAWSRCRCVRWQVALRWRSSSSMKRRCSLAKRSKRWIPSWRCTRAITLPRWTSIARRWPTAAWRPQGAGGSYEAIWCAWGYERDFTVAEIEGTYSKVKELGFKWAVLDDGWQTNEGDWALDPRKFRTEADMVAFVGDPRAGLKAKLWLAPAGRRSRLGPAARPHRHAVAGRRRRGAERHVVERLLPVPGLSADAGLHPEAGQQDHRRVGLSGPEARRPAHERRRALLQPGPQPCAARRSRREAPGFLEDGLRHGAEANPNAVVEFCPCGTSYAFHNFPT
jgi:alpha-galactosidase